MSKMTSSIYTDTESLARKRLQAAASAARAEQQQQQHKQQPSNAKNDKTQLCNCATKTLTNFSIDSIIGGARLAQCDQGARPERDDDAPGEKYEPKAVEGAKNAPNARQATKATENGATSSLKVDSISLPKDLNSIQNNNMAKRERPKHFHCNWCTLKFSNNGQLRNHERIHTGERPFRCQRPDCGRSFTRNEELTRHKMIHSGLRPHICRHCAKRFGRKDHLMKHERTHEKKKSSRRSRIPRSAANLNQPHHELDTFIPIRLDYSGLHPSLPTQPCYNIQNSIIPATTNQLNLFYRANNSLTFTEEQNDLITNQIVSLARAATTSTMTPSIPIMGASFEATQAIMTSASNAMQQLATNYLNNWLNVVGQQG